MHRCLQGMDAPGWHSDDNTTADFNSRCYVWWIKKWREILKVTQAQKGSPIIAFTQ